MESAAHRRLVGPRNQLKKEPAVNRIRLVLATAAALALVTAAPSTAATTKLVANVGPSFTITLTKGGKKVTSLKPGSYSITVNDKSTFHNFHLTGPGRVNKKTTVAFKGTRTWTVTLRKGTYRYVCDPHASQMKGSFRVV
jgi:plastocyanin